MSTLDKLKQKLNFTGASKGLENVNAAAKGVNMTGLGSAVETVTAKFSALQVMGVTALANITNSAVNAGKRIVSALTIDPVRSGMQEYETKMGSIQTILANTQHQGTTMDDVTAALQELNLYADKTIYNFQEMTRNIGTFTAAGVDLETSVKSIQGIANLAAVSGSTSQQASTAMYQLSQALATGTVKLMDWNSVVNAGMGGKVFQNALIQTAAMLDGASEDVAAWQKENIDAYGSFRDSLTEGSWLTSEVLTQTLKQFTMAAKEGSEEWEAYKKSLMDTGYTEAQAVEILKMANTATDAATKVIGKVNPIPTSAPTKARMPRKKRRMVRSLSRLNVPENEALEEDSLRGTGVMPSHTEAITQMIAYMRNAVFQPRAEAAKAGRRTGPRRDPAALTNCPNVRVPVSTSPLTTSCTRGLSDT